jgi:hypothetical protein
MLKPEGSDSIKHRRSDKHFGYSNAQLCPSSVFGNCRKPMDSFDLKIPTVEPSKGASQQKIVTSRFEVRGCRVPLPISKVAGYDPTENSYFKVRGSRFEVNITH